MPRMGQLKYRAYTGRQLRVDGDYAAEDMITSRLFHLIGLEPGLNQGEGVDSYRRCIYIHGTTEESKIGQPASRGCIRMLNDDVIHLFSKVEEGALVWIVPPLKN